MKSSQAKLIIIFCLGFFTLFAQTLLFRDFLTVFEGNELSVGLFFFSWLIWVALGALFARMKVVSESAFMQRNYEVIFLACIPAFILQQYFLQDAAGIVGAAAFERISFGKLVPAALLFNAPVSFLSGLLFVSGCKWMEDSAIPVARVYIWECAGSFAGAASITLLLYFGFAGETVFGGVAGIVAAAVFIFLAKMKKKNYVKLSLSFALAFLLGVGLLSGLDKKMSERNDIRHWKRIMPGAEYMGSFVTSQAKYCYGQYKDQTIVTAWGDVVESFPDYLNAAETLAANIAEKPEARRILVISPGSLFFCGKLAHLKQVEKIVWLDPDLEYPQKLLAAIGDRIRMNMDKIDIAKKDLRSLLKNKNTYFDLIILRLPNPSSLALNRYFTVENFIMLKKALTQKGVLSVSFPGGENFMGPELSYFGASLLFTLKKSFRKIVLKPGGESVFFACDSDGVITDEGHVLQSRLAKIKGASSIYPPENILSSFSADRINFQMSAYSKVIENSRSNLLVNSDSDPKSFLYGLLASVKRLGSFSVGMPLIDKANLLLLPVFLCIVFIYFLFRGAYIFQTRGIKPGGKHLDMCESLFLVFAASFAGMLLNIILIFDYQIQFGSIFLYFGLVVSLFMLGLFVGGSAVSFLLEKKGFYCRSVSLLTLLFAAFIFIFCINPARSQIYFAFLFFVSGFFLGIFMPFSAFQLKISSVPDRRASSALESLDYLAGALGGLSSSLVFLPVLGVSHSFVIIFFLLAIICVMSFCFSRASHEKSGKRGIFSVLIWILAGIFSAVLSSFLIWNSFSPKAEEGRGAGKPEPVKVEKEKKKDDYADKVRGLIKNGKLSGHEAMDFSE